MDPLNKEKIEEAIRNTFTGLTEREKINKTSFKDWPKLQWTPYELEPKRRNSGLEGETTRNITIGKAIGISIGIGIGIGIGSRIPIIRNSIIRTFSLVPISNLPTLTVLP